MQKLLLSTALAAAVLVGCTGDTSDDETDQTQQGFTGSPRSTANQNSNTSKGPNGPYGNPAAHSPPIDQAQIDDPTQNIETTNGHP